MRMGKMVDAFWNMAEFIMDEMLFLIIMLNEREDRWKFKKEQEQGK